MTSANNFSGIVEPVLTAVVMGVPMSVLLCFCQYLGERRRRREFRASLRGGAAQDRAEPPLAARLSPLRHPRAEARAAESFPSFASYFVHHTARYGVAIGSVTLVLVIRWLLEPVLKGSIPFSFFLAAVLLTARTQGIWESLLALLLGFLSGSWFFARPGSLAFSGLHDWWAAVLYFVVGIGILWLSKSEQTAWLRALSSDLSALKHDGEFPPELGANIVESAPIPIISSTPEGCITAWNAAAEKLLGWTAKEAIGQPLAIVFPSGRPEELQQLIRPTGGVDAPKARPMVLTGKSGAQIEALIAISQVNDRLGRRMGVSFFLPERPRDV